MNEWLPFVIFSILVTLLILSAACQTFCFEVEPVDFQQLRDQAHIQEAVESCQFHDHTEIVQLGQSNMNSTEELINEDRDHRDQLLKQEHFDLEAFPNSSVVRVQVHHPRTRNRSSIGSEDQDANSATTSAVTSTLTLTTRLTRLLITLIMDIFVVTRGEGQAPISPPLPPISPSAPAPDIFPVTATGSRERERDQRLPTDFGPHHRRQRQYSAKLDYSGTFHSNYFKADHPIELVQVGFFGPCFEEKAEYFVHVELFEPRNSRELFPECTSPRIAKQKCTLVAQQSQIFYVGFETRVRLEPHVWYLIQFMLDGPCTSRCEYTRRSVQVSAGETNIGFEFNAGSKQMPCLKFRLLHQC